MDGFSTVDGFKEITESLADMIKYLANEPSVGLFYIQQHTQNAVPNLINQKNNLELRSREMTLHTEDLEDSITMVRSMKECGLPIADEMLRDIKRSLAILSTKQPKRGLINSPSSGFQMGRTSSWHPAAWERNADFMKLDGERPGNYLTTVLNSAKQRAGNFKWRQAKDKKPASYPNPPLAVAATHSSFMQNIEADELPLSTQIADELQ